MNGRDGGMTVARPDHRDERFFARDRLGAEKRVEPREVGSSGCLSRASAAGPGTRPIVRPEPAAQTAAPDRRADRLAAAQQRAERAIDFSVKPTEWYDEAAALLVDLIARENDARCSLVRIVGQPDDRAAMVSILFHNRADETRARDSHVVKFKIYRDVPAPDPGVHRVVPGRYHQAGPYHCVSA